MIWRVLPLVRLENNVGTLSENHETILEHHEKEDQRVYEEGNDTNEQPLPPSSVLALLSLQLTTFFPGEQLGIVLGQPFDVPTQHQKAESLVDEVVLALDDAPGQMQQTEEEIPPGRFACLFSQLLELGKGDFNHL